MQNAKRKTQNDASDIDAAIAALPPPACPEGLGEKCPGPFERPVGQRVEGLLDVTVRCQSCQARSHYTLPTTEAAPATGTGELTPSEPPAPVSASSEAGGAHVEPQ